MNNDTSTGSTGSKENETLGNTKTRVNPAKAWCFTLNNYSEEDWEGNGSICSRLLQEDLWIYGKEIAPSTGTPHLQGYIKFSKKVRPMSQIEDKRIHWTLAKGSLEQNYTYCSKEGTFKTNIPKPKVKRPLETLQDNQLYDWEKDILSILDKKPDDRTIHWYWEPKGLAGKTSFCKYLTITRQAVPIEGKKNDILYCAAMFESYIYIMDLERSMEDYVSYGALEKIKNGYYMCAKYESRPITRNPPHLIVFANFPPDTTKLSLDRWNIVRIGQDTTPPNTPVSNGKVIYDVHMLPIGGYSQASLGRFPRAHALGATPQAAPPRPPTS